MGWRGAHWEQVKSAESARIAAWETDLGAAGSRAQRDDGAPNLDSPSLDQKPAWRITLREFSNDVREARGVFVDRFKARGTSRESVERIVCAEEREEQREWRKARARREMKWRCLCLQADHFMTLTKRGKFETIDDAWSAWGLFLSQMRYQHGEFFQFVTVPEQHADGRWHLHVALRGRWDVNELRRYWYRALGGFGDEKGADSPGSINLRQFKAARGSVVIAKYMSKYMGKAFGARGPKRRAYSSSKGLSPKVEKWSHPVEANTVPIYAVLEVLQMRFGGEYEVYEWQESGMSGFIIKTRGS